MCWLTCSSWRYLSTVAKEYSPRFICIRQHSRFHWHSCFWVWLGICIGLFRLAACKRDRPVCCLTDLGESFRVFPLFHIGITINFSKIKKDPLCAVVYQHISLFSGINKFTASKLLVYWLQYSCVLCTVHFLLYCVHSKFFSRVFGRYKVWLLENDLFCHLINHECIDSVFNHLLA